MPYIDVLQRSTYAFLLHEFLKWVDELADDHEHIADDTWLIDRFLTERVYSQ